MNINKNKVFEFYRDISFSHDNKCEINNKSKITIEKIFKKFISNQNNLDPKEYEMKIEFIDKQIDLLYDPSNPVVKKTLEQLENENSQIKQIFVITKDISKYSPPLEIDFDPNKLKDLIREKINNPNSNKIFDFIIKTYENKINPFILDIFEVSLIEVIMERIEFKEFNNYIYFYLNDNLKKMREANPNKDVRIIDTCRKQVEDLLVNFKDEVIDMYQYKNKVIKEVFNTSLQESIISKIDSEDKYKKYFEELTITCIIATKIKDFHELDLSQFYVLNENVLIILTALKANKSVEKLILTTNKLGIEGAWGLPRIYLFNNKLNHIDLSSNGLDDTQMKIISTGFQNLLHPKVNLRHLNISSNISLTQVSGEYIAKIIEKTDCLETLNISKFALGSGFSKIIDALNTKIIINGISTIKSINAISAQIDSLSLMKFADFLGNPKCSLKLLILTDNNLDNDGGKKIMETLRDNKTITNLYLHECNIGDNHSKLINRIINENRTIQELSLYNNKFGPEEIKGFLEELAKIYREKDVDMENSVCYSLIKFDVSKPSNSKEINGIFEDGMINNLKTIEKYNKINNKKMIIDISFNYKIDQNLENELTSIKSPYLKIHI